MVATVREELVCDGEPSNDGDRYTVAVIMNHLCILTSYMDLASQLSWT